MKYIVVISTIIFSASIFASVGHNGANGNGNNGMIGCKLGNKTEYVPRHICEVKQAQYQQKIDKMKKDHMDMKGGIPLEDRDG